MSLARKREVASWCLFDFANSSYSAVISAVVFPVYYARAIVGNADGLGDLWWGRAVSLSMVAVAVSSPVLGGIADYFGIRKRLLFSFTLLCVASVAMFSFLERGMVVEGFLLAVAANIGLEGGMVFYNSFLPLIAGREYQGRVSSWGYAVGYAGSMLSLLISLPLVNRGLFDYTWLMVACFFAAFSLPAFIFLPRDTKTGRLAEAASRGLRYTWRTLKGLWRDREARKFLVAYLIYADGVSTVIVFSSLFAATTLGFEPAELVVLYLVVQATALAGAFAMAKPVDYWGPKKVVTVALVLWSAVCVVAFFIVSKQHFWILASFAGLGLGTVQSSTRAFFAQFIPEGHESEYFGVYSLAGKSSAVVGPLVFGYVSTSFGSQRPAILSVALFFVLGLVIIQAVKGGGPNVARGRR
ncbi:MAG: MFS transporter [Thermodesulfovibrionales bacterium]